MWLVRKKNCKHLFCKILIHLVPLLLIASLALSSRAELLREWVDNTGEYTILAEFVRVDGAKVVLQKFDGKKVSLPLARLSDIDRRYAESRLDEPRGTVETNHKEKAKAQSSVEESTNDQDSPLTLEESRHALLDMLNAERKSMVAPIQDEGQKSEAKVKAIYKKIERLKKVKRLTDRGRKVIYNLQEESQEIEEIIDGLEEGMDSVVDSFNQRRLEILAKHVLPNESPPVKIEGRWMTADQHTSFLQEKQVAENKSKLRINGQRLADWVMRDLGSQYEVKAERRTVTSVSLARMTHVPFSHKPVYSIHPEESNVKMRNVQLSSDTNDSYPFLITWQTRGGQLMQKNGYVEIAYGSDGTAYLQSVDAPFLNNPLDGAMVATRSALDNALGGAFGS